MLSTNTAVTNTMSVQASKEDNKSHKTGEVTHDVRKAIMILVTKHALGAIGTREPVQWILSWQKLS